MSILTNAYESVFGKPTPAPAPQAVQTTNAPAAPTPPPPPPAPLDKLKTTWNTPAPPANAPAPVPSFLEKIDADSVGKAAKTIDFRTAITPEVMAAVAKGGQEGVQAMLDAMNGMNQDVYGKGALATAQIVKKALEEQKNDFLKELPKLIRDQSIRGSAKKANPLFDDPALKPISSALETTFAAQHPNASSDEISAMVKDYFETIAGVLAPKAAPSKTARTKDGRDDIDWEAFASRDNA